MNPSNLEFGFIGNLIRIAYGAALTLVGAPVPVCYGIVTALLPWTNRSN